MCCNSRVSLLLFAFVLFMSDFGVVGDKFLIIHPFYSGSHIPALHSVSEKLVSREEELNEAPADIIVNIHSDIL
jgi:hypothetical protein